MHNHNLIHTKPNPNMLPGFWDIPSYFSEQIYLTSNTNLIKTKITDDIEIIENLLTEQSCIDLINLFTSSNIMAPVSVNGLKDQNLGTGSQRCSGWSQPIAQQLTNIIIPHLAIKQCLDTTATDWWQNGYHRTWKPVAISPLLRYMKYTQNSEHYAHYDAGFFYPDNTHRTLKSLVLYLSTNDIGCTRFINDNQDNLPIWQRNLDDWPRRVNNDEVIYASKPIRGKALIFDHRLCHDVEQYDGKSGDRIIIRGDIIYQKI